MVIGIPKEIMHDEGRVSAIPETVKKLVADGNKVLVEKGAGVGSFFPDADYAAAGAELVDDVADLYKRSDLILKVKEPLYNEAKKRYYIFIGAQTLDKRGCVQVYTSKEPLSGWQFAGQLKVPGYEAFGGMWECPYIVNISGRDVLIFSPQYTKLPGRGESTNHNVYLVGRMDYDTLTFTPEGPYRHLDYGFDFYAAQGAASIGETDKAILIAWIGLPDNHYPTEEEDWEGSLSLPRELRIVDGRLVQTPIPGLKALRGAEILFRPAVDPEGLYETCKTIPQTRAFENQCYFISLNMSGEWLGSYSYGHSMVAAPDGHLVYEAGDNPAALTLTLDIDAVRDARKYGTCYTEQLLRQLPYFDPPMDIYRDLKNAPLYENLPKPDFTIQSRDEHIVANGIQTVSKKRGER